MIEDAYGFAGRGADSADPGVDAETTRRIDFDLPRTFACNTVLVRPDSVACLRRVLCAYAAFRPAVGYTAGANSVASVALLGVGGGAPVGVAGEEDVFWLLVFAADRLGDNFVGGDLSGVAVEQRLLALAVPELVPEAAALHVADAGASAVRHASSAWLVHGFAHSLPPRALFALWDRLLVAPGVHGALDALQGAALACVDRAASVAGRTGAGLAHWPLLLQESAASFASESESEAFNRAATRLTTELTRKFCVDHVRACILADVRRERCEGAERRRAHMLALELHALLPALFAVDELRDLALRPCPLPAVLDACAFARLMRERVRRQRRVALWAQDDADLAALFSWVDADADGRATAREALIAVARVCRGSRDDRARAVFGALDAERCGYLTRAKLLAALEADGARLWRRLFPSGPKELDSAQLSALLGGEPPQEPAPEVVVDELLGTWADPAMLEHRFGEDEFVALARVRPQLVALMCDETPLEPCMPQAQTSAGCTLQ
eukprot:m51a1_g7914 hypothetical protein (501) ;mRNA; r:205182-207945